MPMHEYAWGNPEPSRKLIEAVREQTNEVEVMGGFATDEEAEQIFRDVRDVTARLEVAERLIHQHTLTPHYAEALRQLAERSSKGDDER